MLPSVHFAYTIARYVTGALDVIGGGFLKPNYHIAPTTLATWLFLVGGAICCMFYTMFTKDQDTMMKSSTCVAVAIQGFAKFSMAYASAFTIRDRYDELVNIMVQVERKPCEKGIAALCTWQWGLTFMTRLFVCTMMCNMAVFSFTPVAIYLYSDVMEMPLPIHVPYIDVETVGGFVATCALQITVIILAVLGTIGYDLTMLLLFVGICMVTDVMVVKLQLMGEGLASGGPELQHRPETTAYLHNFVRMHVQFIELLAALNDVYYYAFILEIGLDFMSMCLILFVLTMLTWMPLYVFFMMFLVKTFAACAMGTMIDIYVSESDSIVITFYSE